jgi:antitoxin component of MazEF toxin-antitoxin module
MIQGIQKVIKIGSSGGVTIPAKEMRRQNIKFGDEVEITVRAVSKNSNKSDQDVILAARKILTDYKQDFKNLADR